MQGSRYNDAIPAESGFQNFKKRLNEELLVDWGLTLEDCAEDAFLIKFYRQGESPAYVAEYLGLRCA